MSSTESKCEPDSFCMRRKRALRDSENGNLDSGLMGMNDLSHRACGSSYHTVIIQDAKGMALFNNFALNRI